MNTTNEPEKFTAKKKRASRTRLIQEHSKNFKMKTSRRKSVDWSHWLSELLKVYHLQSNLKQKCRHCGHPFKFQIHRQYYVLLQFCSLKLTFPKKRLPNFWLPDHLVYCYSRSSYLHSRLVINKRGACKNKRMFWATAIHVTTFCFIWAYGLGNS